MSSVVLNQSSWKTSQCRFIKCVQRLSFVNDRYTNLSDFLESTTRRKRQKSDYCSGEHMIMKSNTKQHATFSKYQKHDFYNKRDICSATKLHVSSRPNSILIHNYNNNVMIMSNDFLTNNSMIKMNSKMNFSTSNVQRKKLKKNQLGQKGQNRSQITKDRIEKRNQLQQPKQQSNKKKVSKNNIRKKVTKNQKISTNMFSAYHLANEHMKDEEFDNNSDNSNPTQTSLLSNLDGNDLVKNDLVKNDLDRNDINHDAILNSYSNNVPPALLLPTSTKNIFVAKIYCQKNNINHHDLFLNVHNKRTILFRTNGIGYFEYFPKATYEISSSSKQPEVAFLGRSNVGKSSLINSLIRRSLAITSKHPGRTKKAYYYGYINSSQPDPNRNTNNSNNHHRDNNNSNNNIQDLQNTANGFIIDLPGYGYATSPEHMVSEWQKNVQEFLLMRRDTNNLKRVFLLHDSRTGALPIDLTVQNWMMDASIPYTIIFTKTDCVSKSQLIKHINLACMRYHHQYTEYEFYQMKNYQLQQKEQSRIQSIINDGQPDHPILLNEYDVTAVRPKTSPFIYATSTKSNEGIDEVLHAIDTEFLP